MASLFYIDLPSIRPINVNPCKAYPSASGPSRAQHSMRRWRQVSSAQDHARQPMRRLARASSSAVKPPSGTNRHPGDCRAPVGVSAARLEPLPLPAWANTSTTTRTWHLREGRPPASLSPPREPPCAAGRRGGRWLGRCRARPPPCARADRTARSSPRPARVSFCTIHSTIALDQGERDRDRRLRLGRQHRRLGHQAVGAGDAPSPPTAAITALTASPTRAGAAPAAGGGRRPRRGRSASPPSSATNTWAAAWRGSAGGVALRRRPT